MRKSKCRKCGAEVVKIPLGNGRTAVCESDDRLYWLKNPTTTVVTPNGEEMFAGLVGELKDAHGVGFPIHTCGGAR